MLYGQIKLAELGTLAKFLNDHQGAIAGGSKLGNETKFQNLYLQCFIKRILSKLNKKS